MTDWAGGAVAIAALLVTAWSFVNVARQRGPDPAALVGLAVVELLALVHAGYGVAALARGERPHEFVTFVGYLIAFVLLIPLGAVLARLEPSRWGSVVVQVACVAEAVLVVRLHQVWSGVG